MKRMNYRNTWIFPAFAVTLAMKKPLEEEDTLLQAFTINTRDVESKDTLFFLMSTITCGIAMAIFLVISYTRNTNPV